MDFNAMVQTSLNILTHPGEEPFQEELHKPTATLVNGLILVVIAAVVAAILGWIRFAVFGTAASMAGMIDQMNLPPDAAMQMRSILSGGAMAGLMGASSLGSIITTPVFFLIGVGILHLIAGVVGGHGDFGKFAYLVALYQAPILVVSAIISFVPLLGGCISLLLTLYSIVLTYFAVKVNYGLTGGKAIFVALVPLILVLLVAICSAAVVAGIVVSQF